MSFTGQWKLNLKKSDSQKKVLKLMGRPRWQISFIDEAEEDFILYHFYREKEDIHYFMKNVTIYLNSKVLKKVCALFKIDYDKVRYKHKLVCNERKKDYEDDEKHFGPCSSIASHKEDTFTIKWYIHGKGLLTVNHNVRNGNELHIQMIYENGRGRKEIATKVYDRVPEHETNATFRKILNGIQNGKESLYLQK